MPRRRGLDDETRQTSHKTGRSPPAKEKTTTAMASSWCRTPQELRRPPTSRASRFRSKPDQIHEIRSGLPDPRRHPPPEDHRSIQVASVACTAAADGRSGRRRCASMAAEELRRLRHATWASPGDATGGGGGGDALGGGDEGAGGGDLGAARCAAARGWGRLGERPVTEVYRQSRSGLAFHKTTN